MGNILDRSIDLLDIVSIHDGNHNGMKYQVLGKYQKAKPGKKGQDIEIYNCYILKQLPVQMKIIRSRKLHIENNFSVSLCNGDTIEYREKIGEQSAMMIASSPLILGNTIRYMGIGRMQYWKEVSKHLVKIKAKTKTGTNKNNKEPKTSYVPNNNDLVVNRDICIANDRLNAPMFAQPFNPDTENKDYDPNRFHDVFSSMPPSYQQYLSFLNELTPEEKEKIQESYKKPLPLNVLTEEDRDMLKVECTHRDPNTREFTIRNNKDGSVTCLKCGATFNVVDRLSMEDIKKVIGGTIDIVETTKMLMPDETIANKIPFDIVIEFLLKLDQTYLNAVTAFNELMTRLPNGPIDMGEMMDHANELNMKMVREKRRQNFSKMLAGMKVDDDAVVIKVKSKSTGDDIDFLKSKGDEFLEDCKNLTSDSMYNKYGIVNSQKYKIRDTYCSYFGLDPTDYRNQLRGRQYTK